MPPENSTPITSTTPPAPICSAAWRDTPKHWKATNAALALATNAVERRYLCRRISELESKDADNLARARPRFEPSIGRQRHL